MHWRRFQDMQKVIEVGERFVSYVDRGEGPPLVLLHGIPSWGYLWHAVLPELEKKRRVLIPDLPGYGFSDRSDRFRRGLCAQADMIADWLGALGLERVDLVGHDIGGGVALRLTAYEPELVSRMVLIGSACYDSWPLDALLRVGHPGTDKRLSPAAGAKLLKLELQQGLARPDDLALEGLLAPYQTEAGTLSLARNAAALDASLTMELVPLLPSIQTPTLVLWGEKDPFQPVEHGRRLAWDLPRAELAVLKQGRHFLPLDEPTRTASLILDFLG